MSTVTWCAKCSLSYNRDGSSKGLKICSKCKAVYYCSKDCQSKHWPIHKHMCKPHDPHQTWGIELLCKGEFKKLGTEDESERFKHIRLSDTHPIFTRGEICPALGRCGIPLLIYSPVFHGFRVPRSTEEDSDWHNQPAVYLRIEAHDAFAPLQWQMGGPGTCILARRDHRPLTREAAETMWRWAAKMINAADHPTDDGWAPLTELVNPATFQMFSRDYYERQREKGRMGFDPFFRPL